MLKILEDLVILARERKSNPVEGSYTNKLLEDNSLAKRYIRLSSSIEIFTSENGIPTEFNCSG